MVVAMDMDYGVPGAKAVGYEPARIDASLRAQQVKEGEDITDIRPPERSAVIGRDAPIAVESFVIEGNKVEKVDHAPMQFVDNSVSAHNNRIETVMQAEFREGADDSVGVTGSSVTVESPENGIGVAGVVRTNAEVGKGDRTQKYQGQVEPVRKPPKVEQAPEPEAPVEAQPVVERTPRKRQRVTIQSERMGKQRVSVDKFSVSKRLVVLGYIDDDDSVIVEPPLMKDREDVIEVTIGEDDYRCLYFDTSFEMVIDGHPMLLIVLNRVIE